MSPRVIQCCILPSIAGEALRIVSRLLLVTSLEIRSHWSGQFLVWLEPINQRDCHSNSCDETFHRASSQLWEGLDEASGTRDHRGCPLFHDLSSSGNSHCNSARICILYGIKGNSHFESWIELDLSLINSGWLKSRIAHGCPSGAIGCDCHRGGYLAGRGR